jgi:sterol desaturase/sphingolipid hydroxylase (fatty acid hydroxylase superfamily)
LIDLSQANQAEGIMAVDPSSSGSALSTAGLPIAFVIAFAYVMLKPRRRGRTRFRTALRVMLSKHIWLHSSTLLDFQYVFAGAFFFSVLFGYTLLTGFGVSYATCEGLTRLFGPPAAPANLPLYAKALIIFGLYMAFEFAYWIDHFLSHKVAFLWEFHKVHHSATVLTPFANWRVHPVDTIIYMNIQAIVVGSASGLIQYFAGEAFSLTSTAISGILYALYLALWGHLQHSQFWISCTGLAGRIVLSPAHHQIHHSRNPIHFDKNFGASLALWDWLFRTLHIPQRQNEHLRFGTEGDAHLKQFIPSVLYPFHYAAKRLIAMLPDGAAGSEVAHPLPEPNLAACPADRFSFLDESPLGPDETQIMSSSDVAVLSR